MKPDWDRLGEEFADSASVVIGDADCTAGAKDLCSDQGVSGYPTIKTFIQGEEPQSYNGGRDFDSLKKHVVDNLDKGCDISDEASCSEKEVGYINKMKAKGSDDVAAQITRLEGMKSGKMKPELKKWLTQRLNILTQLKAEADEL